MFLRIHVTSRKTIFFVMRTIRIYNRSMNVAETRDIHDGKNFFVGTYFRHLVCLQSQRAPWINPSTSLSTCYTFPAFPFSYILFHIRSISSERDAGRVFLCQRSAPGADLHGLQMGLTVTQHARCAFEASRSVICTDCETPTVVLVEAFGAFRRNFLPLEPDVGKSKRGSFPSASHLYLERGSRMFLRNVGNRWSLLCSDRRDSSVLHRRYRGPQTRSLYNCEERNRCP